MTIKHWMLLGGLACGCLGVPSIRGQDAAPAPGNPQVPPLIPAPDQTPIPAPLSQSETKKGVNKNAPFPKVTSQRKPVGDLHPGPAVATEKNVNVRGQPLIHSEIVTHLKRGDVVTVLEQVTQKKAGSDEPAKWAKVALPTGSGVWIHSGFVDQAAKTVKANRLNLRSGAGENYSILGRIERGAVVKELEAKGEWIKIEAPTNAYAYVAAHLLSQEPSLIANAAPKSVPAPPAVVEKPVETVAVEPAPVITVPEPIVSPAPVPIAPTIPPPTEISTSAPPAVASSPEPVLAEPEPLIKRVVTREGIVRGSASIQAPTYFVLRSLGNNKTINYLHAVDTNILIRAFQHQRVIVVGEEILDERWPNTPVIDVESIETVP